VEAPPPADVAPGSTGANTGTTSDRPVRKRAIADAGGDPTTIATWIAEVNAQRAATLAQRDTATAQKQAPDRLTEDDIRRLIGSFDNIRNTPARRPQRGQTPSGSRDEWPHGACGDRCDPGR